MRFAMSIMGRRHEARATKEMKKNAPEAERAVRRGKRVRMPLEEFRSMLISGCGCEEEMKTYRNPLCTTTPRSSADDTVNSRPSPRPKLLQWSLVLHCKHR